MDIQSVIMSSVILLSVITPSVIMASVVAPFNIMDAFKHTSHKYFGIVIHSLAE